VRFSGDFWPGAPWKSGSPPRWRPAGPPFGWPWPASRAPPPDAPYVLFGGHIDAWHQGANDEGASNAAMLALARAFHARRDQLRRGPRGTGNSEIPWAGHHREPRGGSPPRMGGSLSLGERPAPNCWHGTLSVAGEGVTEADGEGRGRGGRATVPSFGLAVPVTARMGWSLLLSLGVFILSVLAGLAVLMTVLYLPLLRVVAGIGPRRFLGGTFGGAAVTFSTTSTVAALPVMLEEAKLKLGVTPATADLVLPLGASMYRPGSALFQGASIIFLAYLFQVPIAPAAVGGAVLATFLVSLTVAPVPSSGVVTLAPALDTVGVPLAGLAILLGVDRIPDMFRSTVNALGQLTTAVLVDHWAGARSPVGGEPAGVGREFHLG